MKLLANYFFKARWKTVLILSLVSIIFMSVTMFGNDYIRYIASNASPMGNPLLSIAAFVFILSSIMPIIEFSFKMNKRNVDMYYSLPVKKVHLYMAAYITGLIEVLIPITFAFITNFLFVVLSPNLFCLQYYVPYYFGVVLSSIIIYTFVAFFYIQANTVLDGVVTSIFGVLALPLIYYVLDSIFHFYYYFNVFDGSFLFPYSPMVVISELCFDGIYNIKSDIEYLQSSIVSIVLSSVICILCFVGIYLSAKKSKAEKTMQISDSIFSYKTMIPLYWVTLLIVDDYIIGNSITNFLIAFILSSIFCYLTYCMYQRTFKLKKKYLITIAIIQASAIILSIFKIVMDNLLAL